MTTPAVNVTELDGQIGTLPSSSPKALAIVMVAPPQVAPIPRVYTRISDLVAGVGRRGVGVEAAAYAIDKGLPVLVCPVNSTLAGDTVYQGEGDAIDDSWWTGTSAVTLGTVAPTDDLEIVLQIVVGGTCGTAGIAYKYSLDGGLSWSATTALGTATSVTIEGVQLSFGAGTMVAGDFAKVAVSGPTATAGGISDALTALRNSAIPWDVVLIASPIDGTILDSMESDFDAMFSRGKPKAYVSYFRMPNRYSGADVNETVADYGDAFVAAFGLTATTYGEVCAGAARLASPANKGLRLRRTPAIQVAAETARSSEDVNIADVNRGPLTGTSLADSNGNPDEYDEAINGTLDDMRATVLRTFEGLQGVYVNRPRLLSADGSDFLLMPHRRVMNLAHVTLRNYFTRRLNSSVRVDKRTGHILEAEALEIESGANAALRSVLGAKPKASGWSFVLSRTDNILATRTLTGQARIIPLAYVEAITLDLGFTNPALLTA